jgi:ATP-dependent DNA helicase RecQ
METETESKEIKKARVDLEKYKTQVSEIQVTSGKIASTQALKRHFGHNSFRPLQHDIIESVLAGNDTVAILPTGSGKSITFQLPAMILPGLAVVISPLISLMKDQVDQLRKNGIPAAVYNSTVSESGKRDIFRKLAGGEIKILYISAEGIQAPRLLNFLTSLNVSLIAHDECHVGSAWSHDFRPAFGKLGKLRTNFPNTPIIAVTATATEAVREDICRLLALRQPKVFISSFDRPNLIIQVKRSYSFYNDLNEVIGLNRHTGSTIVYCISRGETVGISQYIESLGYGKTNFYHGGMKKDERRKVQEHFINGKIKTVVATTAFGMGIDKLDVRLVINATMSKSLENYYQEIGRGGRNAELAKVVILYNPDDFNRWKYLIDKKTDTNRLGEKINNNLMIITDYNGEPISKVRAQYLQKENNCLNEQIKQKLNSRDIQTEKLKEVRRYAESVECRRKTILGHFGEVYEKDNCGKCDVCI